MTSGRAATIVAAARDTIASLAEDAATLAAIEATASDVAATIRAGGTVFLFGNGGSAADAQHIAAELVGRFRAERRGLPAHALTTNTSVLTAVANDYGYEHVFERQIDAFAKPGDLAFGISASGGSANVALALALARERGALTVALVGGSPGTVTAAAARSIIVPGTDTQRIQEAHILVGHVICELAERELLEHPND
jgi:D-sedoheptulose 7-phosphate isomerase